MKYTAVLLTLWYVMSVIGFDVHVCKGSGRSFITTFVSTCEDIHPGHDCLPTFCGHNEHKSHAGEESGCCHSSCSHTSDGYTANTCCTDSYQVLSLTGSRCDDEQKFNAACCCHHCPYLVSADITDALSAYFVEKHNLHSYIPNYLSDFDFQSVFAVWRI